ncbi:ABC transporter substrate-binding protein [Oceanibium sediminis]|uniref:ABC transporter substrate-binding protein n=1 Tax=Oceanibium sediminis TaxID=2026339 RepID=UPI001300B6C9|nr:substrate-binding domain-containing protein [Oceanibium sediminis]
MLTSFPREMTDVYQGLWQDAAQGSRLRILNKNTISAIEEIQRGNARAFDLFWASSPEAFELLERSGAFVEPGTCGQDGPAPVEGFAIFSVGWARRRDSTLFMPGDWNDLLLPLYRDQIAMARPARSGSTHLLVEQMLQVRGWEDGWAYLLELSGNLSTLTARSFGVPDGLVNHRFEIGLTIDFLALSRSDVLQFQYGRPIMTITAQVGVLKGGAYPAAACDFVRLLLSPEGQTALLDPQVARIPLDDDIRNAAADRLPSDMIAALRLPWLAYDPDLSADRYWAVNSLFDLMIADVLVTRRGLWHRHHRLHGTAPEDALRQVSALLTKVPVSEAEAREVAKLSGTGLRLVPQVGMEPKEREIIDNWRARSDALLEAADAALTRLEDRYAP